MRLGERLADGRSLRRIAEYTVSVGASMATNFIIVMVLVRLFPPQVYAGFVLVKASLLLLAGIASLGTSQAVVRWIANGEDPRAVFAAAIAAVAALSVPGALVLLAILFELGPRTALVLDAGVVAAVVAVVFLHLVSTELINWARAHQRSATHATLNGMRSALQLVAVVTLVAARREVESYLHGLVVADLLFVIMAAGMRQRWGYPRGRAPDFGMLGAMLRYGWPHALVISGGFLLSTGDRYMLAYMVPDQRLLAYYDAAYVVVGSALALLIRPFNLLIFPAYLRHFRERGADATAALINRWIRHFLIAAFCLAGALTLLQVPILRFLFPEGYTAAASIFAPVSLGVILNGVFIGAVGGLYISAKTWLVGLATAAAIVLNVAANLVLIPLWQLDGAAYATLLAYAVQLIIAYAFARRYLHVKLPILMLCFGAVLLIAAQAFSA